VNTLSLFQLVSDFRTILSRNWRLHNSPTGSIIALLLAWMVARGAHQYRRKEKQKKRSALLGFNKRVQHS
jgi:hypothetical protein